MAEFCKQCAEELFGQEEQFNDTKSTYHYYHNKSPSEFPIPSDGETGMSFLCEGCGGTVVDHNGKCIASWCERHGAVKCLTTE